MKMSALFFFYQKAPRISTDQSLHCNYLHPLYSLEGDTLTEEFPSDHPGHRGIFWAWHQIYADTHDIGDSWIMKNISYAIPEIFTKTETDKAALKLHVLWKSSVFDGGKPFVDEHSCITVHKLNKDLRLIDFEISLKALVPKIQIGGSNDEKGYGGFSLRIKHPEMLSFTSEMGEVIPRNLQIKAGPWMDFTTPVGKSGETNGAVLLCHPDNPSYPEPWILRSKDTSMQNIVFPGKERIQVPMNKSISLRYRLIIHKGRLSMKEIAQLQSDYQKI